MHFPDVYEVVTAKPSQFKARKVGPKAETQKALALILFNADANYPTPRRALVMDTRTLKKFKNAIRNHARGQYRTISRLKGDRLSNMHYVWFVFVENTGASK